MSAAFTPGPWKLRIDPYEDDPFPGKDFFILRFGDDTITGITAPANARLMATAPELFEALADLLSDPESLGKQDDARCVLAKARGDQ